MIKTIVISLTRSVERRRHVTEHLLSLGIPFTFFDAVDGATLLPERRKTFHPSMSAGAMGCAESYRAVLRKIAAGTDDFVLVLEDDAVVSQQALALLDAKRLASLPSFDILRMNTDPQPLKRLMIKIAEINGVDLLTRLRPRFRTTGQIFSRDGARKITPNLNYLARGIDIALFRENCTLGLRIIETRPNLVIGALHLDSTINHDIFLPERKHRDEIRAFISFLLAWNTRLIEARRA